MKPSRILMVIGVTGLLAAGTTAAFACGGHGGGGHPGHGGMEQLRAVYQLDNLSDEQHKQLDALFDKTRKEMRQRRNEHEELHDAMEKATDAKSMRPLAEKQGKFVTEMIMKRFELRNEVDKILTPAQRNQLQQMEERWGGRGGRRQMHGMNGMNGMNGNGMHGMHNMAESGSQM